MDHHKKRRKISLYRETAPLLVLFGLLMLFLLAAAIAKRPDAVYAEANHNDSIYYSPNPMSSQESPGPAEANSKNIKIYTVRLQEGVISIFENSTEEPLYSIDTPVSHLPAADRLLLEQGIRTDSLSAAYKLIEDYE